MAEPKNAIVVIPIYKTDLDANELLSLKRSVQVLKGHKFAIICPEKLDVSPLIPLIEPVDYAIERFDGDYFKGIAGYNKLLLSEVFYERFLAFEFLLICQTDVFVFDDQLLSWCSKNYDYIGAPWLASKQTLLTKSLFAFTNLFKKKKKTKAHFFKVGNGGFSLRKVAMMHRIVNEQKENIALVTANKNAYNHHIEDVYFSLVAPTFIPEIKIPRYVEAASFCIDRRPHLGMEITKNKLPFACHGFNKRNVQEFWKPYLKQYTAL